MKIIGKKTMKCGAPWIAWPLILLPVLAGLPGCMSAQPGSASTAHVVIELAPAEQIRDELVRVFQEDLFEIEEISLQRIVFTRAATQMDVIMYGELLVEKTDIRVEVGVKPYGPEAHLVVADVFVLLDGKVGRKLRTVGSGPYQGRLNRVKAALADPSPFP